VITGFGRTGKWFGLEHYGIEPDIMQFAKGITSGYIPLGGIGVSDAIHEVIDNVAPARRWMHAYTYSGHPTCCAVALKNLEILHDERLIERAAWLGGRLAERLASLARLDGIGHVRSQGLIGAVEIVADKATKALHPPEAQMTTRLTDAMLQRGLVTRVALDCVCIAPPLVISEAELDRVIDIIADAVPAALTR
jgi:putrescine aminotransferase